MIIVRLVARVLEAVMGIVTWAVLMFIFLFPAIFKGPKGLHKIMRDTLNNWDKKVK